MTFIICTAWHQPAIDAAEVVRDLRVKGVVDRAISVPARDLNRRAAERLAREFLQQQRKRGFSLLRLTIGVDPIEVGRSLFHGGPDVTSYESTVAALRQFGAPRRPIARLVATPEGALFSYRDENGLSESLLDGQRDPTRVTMNGTPFRLLHFDVQGRQLDGKRDSFSLDLYFQVMDPPSAGAVGALARLFQRRTEFSRLAVNVRTDVWFLDRSGFPDVYRFSDDSPLPTSVEFRLRPSISCGLLSGRVQCGGQNFKP